MKCKKRCNIRPTLMVPGNVPYFGGPLVRTGIPFISDLVFDFNTRTNYNLIDNIAGETAEIMQFLCGDFIAANTPSIDLGDRPQFSFGNGSSDSAFWVSARIYMRDATNFRIMGKWNADPNIEWLFTTGGTDTLQLILYDDAAGNRRGRATAAITALENQWITVLATYNGVGGANAQDGIDIYIDNVVSDVGDNTGGVYTAMSDTSENVYMGYGSRLADYSDGLMCDVRIGSGTLTEAQRTAILNREYTGTETVIYPDVFSGIDISGNNFHGTNSSVAKGYCNNQDYLLLNGFTQYWDNPTGLVSLQLPYDVNGNPIGGATYTHDGTLYNQSELHPTNAFHNLAESFIGFNEGNDAAAKFNIFDRRNVTVFNATARAGAYYDGTNRITGSRFHISELSQLVLGRNFYNVGWAGRHYIDGFVASIGQADRDYLERIFVYGTDKTSANEREVLDFTNDITHAQGLNPATPSGYIEDADGYIILI